MLEVTYRHCGFNDIMRAVRCIFYEFAASFYARRITREVVTTSSAGVAITVTEELVRLIFRAIFQLYCSQQQPVFTCVTNIVFFSFPRVSLLYKAFFFFLIIWLMLFKPVERNYQLPKAWCKIYNLFIILLNMCSNKSASVNLPRLNGWSAPGCKYSNCWWTGAFPVSGLSSYVHGNEPDSHKFQVKCSEPTEADLKPGKVLQNWSSHQSDHGVFRK